MQMNQESLIPKTLPIHLKNRESARFYIGASDQDIQEMLTSLGLNSLDELYSHIDPSVKFDTAIKIAPPMEYDQLLEHLKSIQAKNKIETSFIGDGLPHFKPSEIINEICNIRGLTTAYTPYQPERSQGTLQSLWIYQSLIAEITGFEAINASLYERSTALFEALCCGLRLKRKSTKVVVADTIYPGDKEVLNTLSDKTEMEILYAPIDETTGLVDQLALKKILTQHEGIAALAYPQVTNLGLIEQVDQLTDLCQEFDIKNIAIINPLDLFAGGLKSPATFGSEQKGADMFVGEGHGLALDVNFGGPGLGLFGIRYNEKDKISIRSSAGRYVGKAKDIKGRDCKALILSTREQHIRREKATSNICSNQSFVATLAGACMLSKGAQGFSASLKHSIDACHQFLKMALQLNGVKLAFQTPFLNQVCLELESDVDTLIEAARKKGFHLGVNVSNRAQKKNLLLISFSDLHGEDEVQTLKDFFINNFSRNEQEVSLPSLQARKDNPNIPLFPKEEIIKYYQELGEQNLSPDDGIYPLGSCTMKYNPLINDQAAGLEGFTKLHPQTPTLDAQGSLEILYSIQEMFKGITGLPGVTTQPVAGAQGELVGLKLFQAYHQDKNELARDTILIPRSAHGTNPATAAMANYKIIEVRAEINGEVDLTHIQEILSNHGNQVAGIMITNPNTAGIFETNFKKIAEMIHQAGGLVYMDGANMNAIAGVIDLNKLGVDAVHNNLHKTWTIPHGGGGPGDAIVAVSEKLIDFLPGLQIKKTNLGFELEKPVKSIGSFHRHHGNFAHKVRAYTYIKALGDEGVKKMGQVAVLSARYLFKRLSAKYPTLPREENPRMHEFILTLSEDTFTKIAKAGIPKAQAIARLGKLFLDFGFHAPTVAFPEVYGLMFEPTETYSKSELDQFANVVEGILELVEEHPEVLNTVPHFTPIDRVDELAANKTPVLSEKIKELPNILSDRLSHHRLRELSVAQIKEEILKAHQRSFQ